MWRLLHDGIGVLNKVGRFVEEIATDCHPCQSSPKTAEHLFLRCPLIQAILFASPLGLRLENNSEVSLKTLISKWLSFNDDGYLF